MLSSSIIVCTRNRLNDIILLIPSVCAQTQPPDEFIIVDSSPLPLTQSQTFVDLFDQKKFLHTRLIYVHTTQAGSAHQRNVGAHNARADILYFFDDDTIVRPDYLEQMNTMFNNNPEYAGGMGSVSNISPKKYSLDRFLRYIFLLQRDYSSGKFTFSGMPTHAYGTDRIKNVEVLGGCCMAYKRDIFLSYLFDTNLGQYAYLEDADLSWRVSRTHKLFYLPYARLIHTKSPLNRATITSRKALFLKNYRYLFFKNIYPHSKKMIVMHWWSIIGLFVCALAAGDMQSLRGYFRGLLS
jgi:GT2 family glycosyltransferase